MSEVCHTCPIALRDSDSPILSLAAARLANVDYKITDASGYKNNNQTPRQTLDAATSETGDTEDALAYLGFDAKKIYQARTCAQHILWKICEFHQSQEL